MKGRGKSIRTGDFFSGRRSGRGTSEEIPKVDLHGLRHHIGVTRVENFMKQQIAAGARAVKIIHGNGQGVMRQVAYDWIERNAKRVSDHEDVGPAVIIHLKRR